MKFVAVAMTRHALPRRHTRHDNQRRHDGMIDAL